MWPDTGCTSGPACGPAHVTHPRAPHPPTLHEQLPQTGSQNGPSAPAVLQEHGWQPLGLAPLKLQLSGAQCAHVAPATLARHRHAPVLPSQIAATVPLVSQSHAAVW